MDRLLVWWLLNQEHPTVNSKQFFSRISYVYVGVRQYAPAACLLCYNVCYCSAMWPSNTTSSSLWPYRRCRWAVFHQFLTCSRRLQCHVHCSPEILSPALLSLSTLVSVLALFRLDEGDCWSNKSGADGDGFHNVGSPFAGRSTPSWQPAWWTTAGRPADGYRLLRAESCRFLALTLSSLPWHCTRCR